MNILLLGANGQVGWELQRSLMSLGHLTICGRHEADFEDLNSLRTLVRQLKPHIIVNAAAYTAVDKAETNAKTAQRINAEAVEVLAAETKKLNALLIHYSTDHVFDGNKVDDYNEQDEANPRNVYGQTKLEGELAIQASGCNHLIFRTTWIYASRGTNFMRTILRLAQEQEKLTIVADQIGAPTSAELVADITALAIHQINERPNTAHEYNGVYHLSASGQTSWHGFAKHIIEKADSLGLPLKTTLNNISPITTGDYPLPALRPASSLLNTNKLCDRFGIRLPHWEGQVNRVLTAFLQQGIV